MEIFVLKNSLADTAQRVADLLVAANLHALRSELTQLEAQSAAPAFWADQQAAQAIMRRLGALQARLVQLENLQNTLASLQTEFANLEQGELDPELQPVLEVELTALISKVDQQEILTFLNGKYDREDAVLSIYAGQGGTEACDWAQMLLRMYVRYCNSVGWEVEIIDEVPGTEAGLASVTCQIHGEFAYGYLKYEHGTHRLVRNSPFNSAGLRQTSFAGVEVMPLVSSDVDVDIREEDLEFAAVRSSGAGGQNVNKVATSVRLVHIPTGLTVTSSTSRSQATNKKNALALLKAKLIKIEEDKFASEQSRLKGEHRDFSWGNQIRNYVLQPYQLVKDVRTNVETANASAVLEGEIQEFIDAEVKLLH